MSRRRLPIQLLALLALLFAAGSPPRAQAQSAGHFYKQGQKAEARDAFEEAYENYSRAYHKEPGDLRYKSAYLRTMVSAAAAHIKHGEMLRDINDDAGALAEFARAKEIDPANERAQQDIDQLKQKELTRPPAQETSLAPGAPDLGTVAGPIALRPMSNEPLTLHMSEDSKVIYQAIGKAAGINVLFDPDYNSKRVQVDLTNVSLLDALRIVGTVTGTFWRPITANTIFVAQNTRAKRTELDEQAVQTFYLSNASQTNDLNDIQTALRNVLANTKLYGIPSQNAIVMRATPDELLLAQKLISDLDKAKPEVVVDVAVLEVSRDKLRNIGLQMPNTVGIALQPTTSSTTSSSSTTPGTNQASCTTNSSGACLTLNDLANLNSKNFAVTISQATANLVLSDSNTRIIQNPRIRAVDGQKADMKIGQRIPVATGSYQTGAATAVVSSLVNTQFQYLDVGVNIDMTPTIHYDRDVTLKLKIEVSAHTGDQNISGVTEPIISQRTVEQVIRLKEGEANILGGILQKQDTRTVGGLAGLGEIPFLKYLFSSQSHEVTDDEIIFMLIPHVVRATTLSPLNVRTIDTGTGGAVELRLVSSSGVPVSATAGEQTGGTGSAPAARPATYAPSAAPAPSASSPGPSPSLTPNAGPNIAPDSTPGSAPAAAPGPAGALAFSITPAIAQQPVGSTFQMSVLVSNARGLASVPLLLQYDNARLALVNVDVGSLLGRDGQPVALVHRDDNGSVTISASRPPGTPGVDGSGTVCTLTFEARAAGDASILIARAGATNAAQQTVAATGSQALVHVR